MKMIAVFVQMIATMGVHQLNFKRFQFSFCPVFLLFFCICWSICISSL